MAYKITDKCISCGACAAECPVGCISQGETKFEINEDSILFFIHIQCHSAGKSNKIEDLHEAV